MKNGEEKTAEENRRAVVARVFTNDAKETSCPEDEAEEIAAQIEVHSRTVAEATAIIREVVAFYVEGLGNPEAADFSRILNALDAIETSTAALSLK